MLNFNHLVRRIGFTASLEFLVERSVVITNNISLTERFNIHSWRALIKEHIKEKTSEKAIDEMINPYSQLQLLTKMSNKIFMGPTLEILIILRHLLKNDQDFNKAVKLVILNQIIYSDGEIFLNLLAADFEKEKCRRILTKMVELKFSILHDSLGYRNKTMKRKLWDSICIKTNKKNNLRSTELGKQLPIEENYLRHTISPRKGWAKSFNLLDNNECSALGLTLMQSLRSHLKLDSSVPFILFPNQHSLAQKRNRIDLNNIKIGLTSKIGLMNCIKDLYQTNNKKNKSTPSENSNLINDIYSVYTDKKRRDKIRNQLPTNILMISFVVYNAVKNTTHTEIQKLMKEMHQKNLFRMHTLRQSEYSAIQILSR